MKKFFIIIILLGCISNLRSQDTFITNDTLFENQCNSWSFNNVIKTDSTFNKNILYASAMNWIALTFNSSKNVIQESDKEDGRINGRGKFVTYTRIFNSKNIIENGYTEFKFNIQCKDGKYKYEFYDFVHIHIDGVVREPLSGDSYKYTDKGWNEIKNSSKKTIYLLIENFKKFMVTTNDW